MENKNKQRAHKRSTSRNLSEEEKRSLLQYEGGEEGAMEGAMEGDMMMEKKMDEMMMEKEKSEEEEIDDSHCCCKYPTAILVYSILLWLFGLLIFFNILVQFANIYFPWYYPFVSLILVFVFFGGLVLLSVWMCKDSYATRTGLKTGGWLILGSVVALILWNVFYILNHNKHKHQGVKVGTGDDPDDYDEEDRSTYLLGYLIWGLIIITLDVLLLCCAINYADSFPPEEGEEDMMEKKEEKMEEKKEEMMMDAEMGGEEVMMEGGQVERRRSSSRASMASRRNTRSNSRKAAPRGLTKKQQAQRAAAFREIKADSTPRGSFNKELNYEKGKDLQVVQFKK